MNDLYELALVLLVAVCVALLALWLMRVNARKHVREDYSRLMRRHQDINKHLPPRGDTLLESLVMIVFCAVVAAAIVVCLSDEEDFRSGAESSLSLHADESSALHKEVRHE